MAANGSTNGHRNPVPPSGIWVPACTLFDPETDELVLEEQAKYYAHLSKTGLVGLVILGTNAETFLLTQAERKALISTARQACGPSFPIMAGCSGHSTKQTLEFLGDAADAGADYALVLPPAYFAKQSTPAVVERFFDDVAARSPLPIVIYNFPGVCNGVDLDSDQLARLAKRHPGKIVGVKLTCGVVAKITRLSAALRPDEFATFGGQSDFLIGGLASGSAGCICAFGNAFPRTVVKMYDLWTAGKQEEALKLHHIAAMAERGTKGGIATVKYASSVYNAGTEKGQAGIERAGELMLPRHPYTGLTDEAKKTLREIMDPCWEIEKSLQ